MHNERPILLSPAQEADDDARWQALVHRQPRVDIFYAVTTTGIYCRPGCPARTPLRAHVRYFGTTDAARAAGFRACKRCRPDA